MMNKKYWLICWVLFPLQLLAIPARIDSLNNLLKKERTDTGRAKLLRSLSSEYKSFRPDMALDLAQRSLILSKRAHFVSGELDALYEMASSYRSLGNYPKALEYYLEQLKLAEKNEDHEERAIILINISNVYQEEGDHQKALDYALEANKIIEENDYDYLRYYSYFNLGDIYEKRNDIGNALSSTYKAFSIAKRRNMPEVYGNCLNNLGNIYNRDNKLETALVQYQEGIPYLLQYHRDDILCESYMGIANVCYKQRKIDSAILYARQSLGLAQHAGFGKRILTASNALNKFYSNSGSIDSAYHYQSMLMTLKDSIYSQERIKQIQNLTLVETMRQKELAELKKIENKERKKRLQLLLVGLLIPLSFLVSVMLSKRKVKPRVIEFSGIISLLLFFEYITMFIHPWVMEVTHHTPAYEIIIFVLIAAVITPSHHRFEHWLISRLTTHRGRKYQRHDHEP